MPLIPLLFLILLAGSLVGRAEIEEEFPLGIEVVTGLRSDYVYRGFHLAGTVLDAQVETEVALQDDLVLTLGGWLVSEMGDDFSELGAGLGMRKTLADHLDLGAEIEVRSRETDLLGDSQELSAYLEYFPTRDWRFKALLGHEWELDGWYAAAEAGWSHRLNDDAFLSLSSGLSWVDGYLDREGLNDLYGRASLTYLINNSVSLTPFAGWSYLLDDDDDGKDRIFAGIWFEVLF